jgi:phage terminase
MGILFSAGTWITIFIKLDPAGNIKPDKEKSTVKIDGTVALIMALDRAIQCGCASEDFIYDIRNMLIL